MATDQETPLGFAQLYQDLFVPAVFDPAAEALVTMAAPRRGEAVLDLACGTGAVARKVAPHVGPEGSVIGLDARPTMLAVAASVRHPGGAEITWVEGDATAPALAEGSLDLVLCQAGLPFFSDRLGALSAARSALRRGGRLALSVWQSLDRHPVMKVLIEAEVRHLAPLGVSEDDATRPFALGDADRLTVLLARGGFEGIEFAPATILVRIEPIEEFVPSMERAYAAFMPQFTEDPSLFDAFVAAVQRDVAPTLERFREGDAIVYPMHALMALARRW